ncbi:CHAT domain-containing protein [Streptomyces sp. NBC_01808]|uniref:CHAT domain-containing protein n=1 Tax=Streptomyces sp. NBC_01808 TaxID=2975947 RepID=UPI002DD9C24A|nr:CHAT domain-containing protein [Streptomyces sp. NBC_01808]WSA40187.1 CHAT domain-containing protein [Streptomyces sp. NBC_01808]
MSPHRDELLADLRRLVGCARATGDTGPLHGAGAERAAAALAPVVGPASDPDTAAVLGWFHWLRFRPGTANGEEDLVQAARFLAPVHAADPRAVPAELAAVYTDGGGPEADAEEALECGLLLLLAYERDALAPLLGRAVGLLRAAAAGSSLHALDRAMALNNLGHALRITYETTGEAAALDEAVAAARQAARATSHPEHPMFLSNLGLALFRLFGRDGDPTALDEGITVCRRAVVATRPGHPHLVRYRTHLGLLRARWAQVHDDAAAGAEAVALLRLAVSGTPPRDPARAARLLLLAAALDAQFRRTGDGAYLSEAVAVGRQAVAMTPGGHPQRAEAVGGLAEVLTELGRRTGDPALLREAVGAARTAVSAAGGPQRATCLHRLGRSLQMLAETVPEEGGAAAAEAVSVAREAVAADPHEAEFLDRLSQALLARFEHTGDVDSLTGAADAGRSAVAATPRGVPEHAGRASNLVFTLFRLHDVVADDDVLWEAVGIGREAVAALPEGHRYRSSALSHLGAVLIRAYEHTARVALAEEAVACHRRAVAESPDAATRSKWLMNLGMALASLARGEGTREPAEEAAAVLRKALGGMSDDSPHRTTALNNLVHALCGVAPFAEDPLVVMRDAARTARAAVAATPARHPYRALHLNSLGLVLLRLAWYTSDSAPVRDAVTACRDACEAAPRHHPHRAMFLGNLCSALEMSFARTGREEDIAEAVEVCREGLATLPADHPYRARLRHGLADALLTRAVRGDDESALEDALGVSRECVARAEDEGGAEAGDAGAVSVEARSLLVRALVLTALRNEDAVLLHEALTHTHEVVARTGPEALGHSGALYQHALVLFLLYDRTGEHALLEEVLSAARTVAGDESAEPETRIHGHRLLAALADATEALSSAESIVALLPQLGGGSLDLGDRGQVLGNLGALAPALAGAAMSAGRPGQAVELLEQSRGVLTAESVAAVGTDLDRLYSAAPDLAAAFVDLRNRCQALDLPVPALQDSPVTPETRAAVRLETRTAWHALLRRIRTLDGFADFLMPPRAAVLTTTAAEGPVVYVYAMPKRCDALVLTGDPDDPVSVVPLHDLQESDVVRQARALGAALDSSVDPTKGPMARRAAQSQVLDVLAWLWDTVAEPVLTALGHTAPPAPGEPWPRLWWCPVGNLAHLPLHAAGHHGDLADDSPYRRAPRTGLDRVVSSYTTTVRGLARARADRPRARSGLRTAIVAVPDAPGTGALPGAAAEAALLAGLVPGATVLPDPTRASVLAALAGHPVVHIACHHRPARIDPWQGQLLLRDHQRDPLTVSDIAALRLNGGLAYLSACSTTVTRLPDEALHLTGAFQLSGYPHVVGTLWPVGDRPAQQLAADFYGRLTEDGRTAPDLTHAPTALHHAVRALRANYPRTPTTWAAHTHTGV